MVIILGNCCPCVCGGLDGWRLGGLNDLLNFGYVELFFNIGVI